MTLQEALEENCPVEFESLEVVYFNSWADYEEDGTIVVFDLLGEMFAVEFGHCVMCEDNSFDFDPYPVTKDQLEEIKKE